MHKPIFFDLPVMHFFGSLRSPGLTLVLGQITNLGGVVAIAVVVAMLAALQIMKRQYVELKYIITALVGASFLSSLLKLVFSRERPSYLTHLVAEGGYSFPSGHATGSSALAIVCLLILWNTRWRWVAVGIGSAYVLAVGISRVYLGVHYPSDILAGWCVSWLWIGLVSYLFFTKSRPTNPKLSSQNPAKTSIKA